MTNTIDILGYQGNVYEKTNNENHVTAYCYRRYFRLINPTDQEVAAAKISASKKERSNPTYR